MTEISKFLEVAADERHFGSYYKIAQLLGVPPSTMYRARDTGRLADWHCMQLAEMLGLNPLLLIASKKVDLETDSERKLKWKEILDTQCEKEGIDPNRVSEALTANLEEMPAYPDSDSLYYRK